jgi:acetylornithine/succinyldiaminopimelate/putrescine aminotransferase
MNYSNRSIFMELVGQTSPFPLGLEVEKAEGIYIYATNGKKYLDMISGIAVSNLGHGNKNIIKAVQDQAQKYMHTMVYGEHIQSPQIEFAKKLTDLLPENLNGVFYVNSGSEAVEGAMKLSKRYTGRYEIIACRNGYHGNTHGSQSLMDNEYLSQAYRPFVPGIRFIEYDNIESLEFITKKTAAVITETIQGDIGIKIARQEFMQALREKCDETGTLLVFDEIQTGFGRTGKLFAFEHYNIIPDILLVAKAMGGGMPTGALIADRRLLQVFTNNPILGYISTFGGHPVSLAAAVAALDELTEKNIINSIQKKEKLFLKYLKHSAIKEIRYKGLFFAVDLGDTDFVKRVINSAYENGVLMDWFLYNDSAFRLAPPLIIEEEEIKSACDIIVDAIEANI